MQIYYVKISCKEDVHICRTNFAKQMEQNLHETTSQWKTYGKMWKTYGKRLFSRTLKFEMWKIAHSQKGAQKKKNPQEKEAKGRWSRQAGRSGDPVQKDP
jgi:hypothetical protein